MALRRRLARWRLALRLRARVPSSAVIEAVPILAGKRRIEISPHVLIGREVYLETRGSATIRLDKNVALRRGVSLVAHHGIEVGQGTEIGENCLIRDVTRPLKEPGGGEANRIKIGRDVWIGAGVEICPGVTIGDGAVVGANSVVRESVPPGLLVAGIPARPTDRVLVGPGFELRATPSV